jgi:hypothetical protein
MPFQSWIQSREIRTFFAVIFFLQNSWVGAGRRGHFSIPCSRRFIFCWKCPDRVWVPHTILFSEYWGLFFSGLSRPGRWLRVGISCSPYVFMVFMETALPIHLFFLVQQACSARRGHDTFLQNFSRKADVKRPLGRSRRIILKWISDVVWGCELHLACVR